MLYINRYLRGKESDMRRNYLDNIRRATVVSVVFYHVFYIYNNSGVAGGIGPITDNRYGDILPYFLYPWFMFLLFAVSGASARYSLEKRSHREFLRAETRKLLIPSTVGLFVFWWILGYYNVRFADAFDISSVPLPIRYLIYVFSGIGPLWYIQMLWLFSVLLILFRKIEKDRLYRLCEKIGVIPLLLFFLPIWGSAQILNAPLIKVYRFGFYGAAYLIGYLFFSQDAIMEKLKKQSVFLLLSAVTAGIAFIRIYFATPYTDDTVLRSPLCNLYAWLMTLAILACMKRWGDFENGFTVFGNKISRGLYLFHYLPLAVCADIVYKASFPAAVKYGLTALSSFVGAFLLYEIFSRIPVLRTLVCGIRKK